MNIFQLDLDPVKAAQYHPDRHVVKMILEYSQLLSTAHRILDGTEHATTSKTGRRATAWRLEDDRESILYKATHINHPSAIWARESASNYLWLQSLLVAVCHEYTHRYGKHHKCERDGLVSRLESLPNNMTKIRRTPLRLAMPLEYQLPDPVESYRKYLREGKVHLHSWKKRPTPEWI